MQIKLSSSSGVVPLDSTERFSGSEGGPAKLGDIRDRSAGNSKRGGAGGANMTNKPRASPLSAATEKLFHLLFKRTHLFANTTLLSVRRNAKYVGHNWKDYYLQGTSP
jgi:hypothetical protein